MTAEIVPIKAEAGTRLCRDCKWYALASTGPEFSRCTCPDNVKVIQAKRRAETYALIDPDIKVVPELPFCELERGFDFETHCGRAGRRWVARSGEPS